MEESNKNKRKKKKKSEMKQKNSKQRECVEISNRERKKKVSKEECARVFWAAHVSELLPQVFSPFWEKNILVGPRRKHLGPPHFFPLPLPTKHTLKLLSLNFSLLNFLSSLKFL